MNTQVQETILMVTAEEFYKLVGKVENIERIVNQLSKEIYGNGQAGLAKTVTRIESRLDALEKQFCNFESSIGDKLDDMAAKSGERFDETRATNDLLKQHVSDPNKHTLRGLLFMDKDSPVLFKIAATIIILILTGGAAANVVQFIKAIFGL